MGFATGGAGRGSGLATTRGAGSGGVTTGSGSGSGAASPSVGAVSGAACAIGSGEVASGAISSDKLTVIRSGGAWNVLRDGASASHATSPACSAIATTTPIFSSGLRREG